MKEALVRLDGDKGKGAKNPILGRLLMFKYGPVGDTHTTWGLSLMTSAKFCTPTPLSL